MASHCTGPSGSPCINAPDTIATTGTRIDDSPATCAGNRPTIENQRQVADAIGTSAM